MNEVSKGTEGIGIDLLSENIRQSIVGVENLHAENRRLSAQIGSLESTKLRLESEAQFLRLALDSERAERRHYHSLANEIITRLDVVGRTVDDVVQRAQHEVNSKRKEQPSGELAELRIPNFLKQAITKDGPAEPKAERSQARPTAAEGRNIRTVHAQQG